MQYNSPLGMSGDDNEQSNDISHSIHYEEFYLLTSEAL